MSILNAVKLAVVAAVFVKVATSSYKCAKFLGNCSEKFDFLASKGYTQAQMMEMTTEELMAAVEKEA